MKLYEGSFIGLVSLTCWIGQDEEFCNRYAHAREAQADFLLEELAAVKSSWPS